ncbi:MAG: AAA family ATPase, partial [Thermodesulfobacteriaceae bacterium]|nr:AAA family ATPase [Thermodesulfobacteriaceae bacterium]
MPYSIIIKIMKLPIGIQSFEEIRTGGYYYVDKTPFVAKLVNEGKYYFLSRPRRFGKSLFLDTLKQAFLGKKELFEGLYLEKNWDWEIRYPVIHLDFGKGDFHLESGLLETINTHLQFYQELYEVKLSSSTSLSVALKFYELIERLYQKFKKKVVV